MTMFLRHGISGFLHMNDDPLPACDLVEFRSFCYAAAREADCSIKHAGRRPHVERSFTTGVFALPQGDIAALLNLHFPVIGFAKSLPDEESCELEFVDCEVLANVFKNSGRYDVLSKSDLARIIHDG